MTPEQIQTRMEEMLAEEQAAGVKGLWWLSFADETGFKGVVIVEAYGFTSALLATKAQGLNPGGEVRGERVDPDLIPKAMLNRLLKKADLAGFGVSTRA
jgi:hypothetical protein